MNILVSLEAGIYRGADGAIGKQKNFADVAKLVDVPDLGSGAARRVGSSPSIRTYLFYQTPDVACCGVSLGVDLRALRQPASFRTAL